MSIKDNAKVLKKVFKVASIIVIAYAIFMLGLFAGDFRTEDQTVLEFFMTEDSYTVSTGHWDKSDLNLTDGYGFSIELTGDGGDIPPELQKKVDRYNEITGIVWIAVILHFLVMIADYPIDPKNHFFTKLIDIIKKQAGKDE